MLNPIIDFLLEDPGDVELGVVGSSPPPAVTCLPTPKKEDIYIGLVSS